MPNTPTLPPAPAPQTLLQLLPLHLQASLASFLSLQNALRSANGASSNSSVKWPNSNAGPDLSSLPPPFKQAILRESLKRQEETILGVQHFLRYSFESVRFPAPPATVWTKHAARLYHFEASQDKAACLPLLVVPSLINRYYILDLDEQRSLVRYLAAQGHDVYLLDWGSPTAVEQAFRIEDYVRELLAPAAQVIRQRHGHAPGVIGYCMGGLLTMALASLFPESAARLALLAMPWHFHSDDAAHLRLSPARTATLRQMLARMPYLPGEAILYLFYLTDPWRFQEKFRQFPHLKGKAEKDYFTAIEHWANDCVPLPRQVAVECFVDFQQENLTYRCQWTLGEHIVDPARLTLPVFIAAPQQDRIVPPGSAAALSDQLPCVQLHQPETGHIGMITGARRKQELWKPLTRWLAT